MKIGFHETAKRGKSTYHVVCRENYTPVLAIVADNIPRKSSREWILTHKIVGVSID